ncbi:MAG: two-component system response regulator [Armatimonadetes bacterium CG_4_10_14_3_um_filter_66_18]|nr:response regulator [Armatimonadota bacterium]PIU95518.1 MAG: two-component system response regulator [Armatimonadetes bacterium CG06_land_8_20_14_3_00_66_21]PIY37010.1 MAG: two-component system response regulator [Armatimonadetes bacterium CG_4_10_14_3_um_filter_66_18]PIZ48341.1 MAG: two-component system response regulator [Armatimonadetes bacterium CG_4_10_14_0_8_um_filter_66_14]PJB62616.1 MAG: two-component system response regulator [Armatimonadetes bacterium CG_4_9_14_3_um_filter_66_14]
MVSSSSILNASLLIVDDLEANVRLLERMLHGAGYTSVASTMTPHEVCALHLEHRYDLIVLDLQMPDMDGFQVMEGLKEIETEGYLPVLVITAQPGHKVRALQAGARDFLSKPFDLPEVLTRVHNMVETRLLHKELRQHNDVLEERVRGRTQELRDTRLEVIHRLTRAAELRDYETGLHVVRIGLFCAQLGEALGLGSAECELLLNAAPMHDLGKIGIPDFILLKPDKLTPPEWEVMKTHTTLGAELLAEGQSELTQMGHLIALTHHERMDGSGYPRGVAGEDIPLVAQICGVCDVFDALTSARPYKSAWSVEEATASIQEQRHFAPSLIDRFMQVLPRLADIKRRYAEPARDTSDRGPDYETPQPPEAA